MTKEATKQKVLNNLVKGGFNPNEAKQYVDEHFDFAYRQFSTVRKMAEYVITVD